MGAFITPYDVANQALQMLGAPRITAFSDSTRQAAEASFAYDKARRAELRRFVWTFATRRAPLRPVTDTTVNLTFPAYASGTTYAGGDIVTYNDPLAASQLIYTSTGASNLGNTPGLGTTYWESYFGSVQADTYSNSTTYFPGDMVVSAGTVYRYIARTGSAGHTPPNATYWLAPTGVTTGTPVYLGAFGYDAPTGTTQRTAYRLPANFVRLAPQDPKQPSVARLGTSGGILYNDWEIENGFLFSAATTGGLIFRHVSDAVIVSQMDDMFCMAVACRMALLLNEILTQRPDLEDRIRNDYSRFVSEAQAVSAIEGGSTEADIGAAPPPQAPPARGR